MELYASGLLVQDVRDWSAGGQPVDDSREHLEVSVLLQLSTHVFHSEHKFVPMGTVGRCSSRIERRCNTILKSFIQ